MALTINPVVSRTSRSWALHTFSFLVGTFVGSLVPLLAALLLAEFLRSATSENAVLVGAVAAICWGMLHDLGAPVPLPYRSKQVPEWLRGALPPVALAATFGFMLGLGFFTLFTYSTHIALVAGFPFVNSLGGMLLVNCAFAVGKTIVLAASFGASSLSEITPRFRWSPAGDRVLRATTVSASLFIALAIIFNLD